MDSELLALTASYNPQNTADHYSLSDNEKMYLSVVRKPDLQEDEKSALVKIEMPSDLDDPKHWGHLGYKYVCFRRSQDMK